MTNSATPTFDLPIIDAEINAENIVPFYLNQHMARLLLDEPFFASLSRRIDKRIKTDIPTAGVWISEQTGNF